MGFAETPTKAPFQRKGRLTWLSVSPGKFLQIVKIKVFLKLILNPHITRLRSPVQQNLNKLPFGGADTEACGSVICDSELGKLPERVSEKNKNKTKRKKRDLILPLLTCFHSSGLGPVVDPPPDWTTPQSACLLAAPTHVPLFSKSTFCCP